MKFNFDAKINKLISDISYLPNTLSKVIDPNIVFLNIDIFTRNLDRLSEHKKISNKDYAKLRRQISFLYTIRLNSKEKAKEHLAKNSKVEEGKDQEDTLLFNSTCYEILVADIKAIYHCKHLIDKDLIKLGLTYGVVELTKEEIDILVEFTISNNNIQTINNILSRSV